MSVLAAGYNIIINKKLGNVNTPLYPITSTNNVVDAEGNTLTDILASVESGYVPDYSGETPSSLRFLRNDNTWQNIQDASTSQKGVVQLTSEYNPVETASSTLALTQAGAKAIYDNFANYVPTSQLGAASGVAQLDANGKVPAAQLPSYVDDVVEGYLHDGSFYEDDAYQTLITPEGGKIYIDIATRKTYRYGGSASGYVEISESLAIGETVGTAYDGAAGKALADKLATVSSGATKTEASTTNGNIVIDDTEVTVFTPATASGSNAGYMSASDFTKLAGISAEANKVTSSATNGHINIDGVDTTVFTPDTVSGSNAGYMTSAMYNKFVNMAEVAVSDTAPTFSDSASDGLWFELVSQYTPE